MYLPDTTSYSEFRENLADHFKRLKKSSKPTVVLQKGKAAAVVLSPAQFEAYSDARETLDVLLAIEQGREDYAKGRTIPWEQARRELLAKARPPARRKRR